MMQTKFFSLLRHGTAVNNYKDDDVLRTLTGRGEDQIADTAFFAQNYGWLPELILCSTSERTKMSADIFCEQSGCQANIIFMENLYLATADEVLATVADMPQELTSIMIIGHNMGLENLVLDLSGKYSDHKNSLTMSPGTLAIFKTDAQYWEDVNYCNSNLLEIFSPEQG